MNLKLALKPLLALSAFTALGAGHFVPPAAAQDGYPYSIMREEPGVKPRAPRAPHGPGWGGETLREPTQKAVPRRARVGSSSPSPLPPPRSVVTPLGTAPRIITTEPMRTPSSPGMIVPGMRTTTGGPAVTPSRPSGQNFQDRAINCVHSGSAQVGPGQIGAFTQSCVNQ